MKRMLGALVAMGLLLGPTIGCGDPPKEKPKLKPDTPKIDAPKTDTPKADAPKTDPPKTGEREIKKDG